MMHDTQISELREELNSPKNIVLIPHRNPDGDAMGSTLGLAQALQALGHQTTVISPNDFPEFLAWMPNSEKTVLFEGNTEAATALLNAADLIFTLDFNAFHRTGDLMGGVLATLDKTFVMIDHHQLPDPYAKYMYSDTKMSSTCEMVYHFLDALGYTHLLDINGATCLYTGIVTDTGSFRFPNTTSVTHQVVAALVDKGVQNDVVYTSLFNNSTYSRLQLLGQALSNLKLLPQYKASYITLSQEELNKFQFIKGDTEGIVNYGLSIKGIDLAAIFIENKAEGIIKISFRSQGSFDVNQFARDHFNGGGHINAAGGKSFDTLAVTIEKFISILATANNA
ncbi:MAG: bifunctional oligoribonuclease/PAP phosphatase NrnA [Flavobacterium sp.]|nr:bifunctional oligoribonuclease/PAP phosphatase NrnA [Candidatus Neoflavobacterium equi]